ncbi:hypothetical protein AM587_10004193 [Phytophthora nicotianae]|nr:hypothetical protein AM587_10004193 [Phytophthora nicotianae]
MVAQVDSPATPVLESTYQHIGDSKRHWKITSMVYHGVLIAVIVAAIVILVMVQTEVVDVGDSEDTDDWVEVSSQIINGVFTWLAVTNQPLYVYRFVMTTVALKASTGQQNEKMEVTRAAGHLSKIFPHIFVSKSGICCETSAMASQAQERGEVQDSSDENEVLEVGNFIFFRTDVRYLRNTLGILNCGCLIQYVMSGYMWGYDESSRPAFALPVLLPPAILCNVIGQYGFYQLKKKSDGRQVIPVRSGPVADKLSSSRNSFV